MPEDKDEHRPDTSSKPDPDRAWIERRRRVSGAQDREPITDGQLAALMAERERTGVGSIAFLRRCDDIPAYLTASKIENWIRGSSKTASIAEFEYVLEKYRSLPPAPPEVKQLRPNRIVVSDEMLAALKHEFERTGASATHLIRIRPPHLHDLTAMKISAWRTRRIKQVYEGHWTYVLETLKNLPDRRPSMPKPPPPSKHVATRYAGTQYIPITAEIRDRLSDERDRTGIDHNGLVKMHPDELNGVKPRTINLWITGRIRSADPCALDAVLTAYAGLPDSENIRGGRLIEMTSQHVALLLGEYERTGVGTHKLFTNERNVPEGLDPGAIIRWLDGRTKIVERAHYDYVLRCWQAFPSKAVVTITPAMREEFDHHLSRTGITMVALRRLLPPRPYPPSASAIRSWRSGAAKTMKLSHWESAIETLRALPDYEPPDSRNRSSPKCSERGRRRRGPPRDVLDLFE